MFPDGPGESSCLIGPSLLFVYMNLASCKYYLYTCHGEGSGLDHMKESRSYCCCAQGAVTLFLEGPGASSRLIGTSLFKGCIFPLEGASPILSGNSDWFSDSREHLKIYSLVQIPGALPSRKYKGRDFCFVVRS